MPGRIAARVPRLPKHDADGSQFIASAFTNSAYHNPFHRSTETYTEHFASGSQRHGSRDDAGFGADGPNLAAIKWEAEVEERGNVFDVNVFDVSATGDTQEHASAAQTWAPAVTDEEAAADDDGGSRPFDHVAVVAAMESMQGAGQFGVEIDCILDEPMTRATIAHDLTHHSLNHNPYGTRGGATPTDLSSKFQFYPTDYSDRALWGQWKIKPDYTHVKSCSGEKIKSFQLVSPVLTTENPAAVHHALSTVFMMLRSMGVRTDPTGGMHVHLDVSDKTTAELVSFTQRWVRLEAGVDTLVPADRLRHSVEALASNALLVSSAAASAAAETAAYLEEARSVGELVARFNPTGRFAKVNLTNLLLRAPHGQETIEFRCHHAVLDPVAVMCFVGLAASVLHNPLQISAESVAAAAAERPPPAQGTKTKKGKKRGRKASAFDELMAHVPSVALRNYYVARRGDVRALHESYARNVLQRVESGGQEAIARLSGVLGGTEARRVVKAWRRQQKLLSAGGSGGGGGGSSPSGLATTAPATAPATAAAAAAPALFSSDVKNLLSHGHPMETEGGRLWYYSGKTAAIAPRDHAYKEAFPIITSGQGLKAYHHEEDQLSVSDDAQPTTFFPDSPDDPLPPIVGGTAL
eukprot:Rhum_TRINITY_DN8630_c0_g1::Rhum_TRINITY_DN8630_c0_g1_i1::g.29109::m.29109